MSLFSAGSQKEQQKWH